ncbi:hypothetical protein [Kitasatospora sp. CB01950]|uniref:hypothetical protein n=1 Tax=Kitasatospora sp. CB01950 TaxID=1703930 RepID=UPI00093F1110|nr:hypothetical protein [Kitasatospora sp. CB01950]OKJ10306.1 hypothetical protein AMK19_15675 [Kitasatospora sp. CB01950]
MTHRPTPSTRTRVGGALLAATALIPAAAAWYLFGVMLPDDAQELRSYRAAAACPTGEPLAAVEECVRSVSFTVTDATVHGGRNPKYRATLTGTPFWNGEVLFGNPGPVVENLTSGDQVDGTVWRGRVMRLERDGVSQATSDEPRDEPQFTAALGTYATLAAVLLATLGVLRFTGRPCRAAVYRALFLTTLLACGAPAVLAYWTGLPWWTVPVAAVPAALLLAEAVRRWNPGKIPAAPQGW